MSAYGRLTFRLAAADEERLAAELWELGTLGVELEALDGGELLARAYFADPRQAAMRRPPEAWARLGAELVERGRLAERDWLADYRSRSRPFAVGRRFTVDPREPHGDAVAAGGGRTLLRLPAREAFGIGSHESTRLAIELLEEQPLAGRAVLDVGTGSGILAFAALSLGAASAVGVEIDPGAALVAAQNRRLNALAPRLFAGRAAALSPRRPFDLVLANVLPEALLPELADVARLTRAGGRAILSGILDARAAEVEARFAAAGFRLRARRAAGEWRALVGEREGA